MYIYIVTIIFAWLFWKLLRVIQRRQERYARLADVPKLPEDHWLWGVTNQIDDLDGLMKLCAKFMEQKPLKWMTLRMSFALCPIVLVHPDNMKAVLTANNVPKTRGWNSAYRMLLPWLGEGLLVSNGKKWERNRRLLTPAFHFDILKPYVKIVDKVADIFLAKIKDTSKNGTSIDVYPLVSRATLDTMLRCTLSYNDDYVQNTGEKGNQYVEAIHTLTRLLAGRLMNPVFFFDFVFYLTTAGREYKKLCGFVHEFSSKIIEARQSSLENDPSQIDKRHLDFLDILITAKDENGVGLTQQEIKDEVDTFMFEGHDTTASAVSWAMHALAKYPDMQQKVREEVAKVLDGRTSLTVDDLPNLLYTTCFMKETMRMYSPVPGVERELVEPLTIEGVTFQPGDVVYICPYLIHHNPIVWDNHMEFRPERFSRENSEARDPFAFLGFSAGHRNCIGQHFAMNEMKVLITRLVTRFNISLDPQKEAVPYMQIITRAKGGLYLHFEER